MTSWFLKLVNTILFFLPISSWFLEILHFMKKEKTLFGSIVGNCALGEEIDWWGRKTYGRGDEAEETAVCNAFCRNQHPCLIARSLSTDCGNVLWTWEILFSTHIRSRSIQNPTRTRSKGSTSSIKENMEERRPKNVCNGPIESHSSGSRGTRHKWRVHSQSLRIQREMLNCVSWSERIEPSLLYFWSLMELVPIDAFKTVQNDSKPQKPPVSLL